MVEYIHRVCMLNLLRSGCRASPNKLASWSSSLISAMYLTGTYICNLFLFSRQTQSGAVQAAVQRIQQLGKYLVICVMFRPQYMPECSEECESCLRYPLLSMALYDLCAIQ